MCYPCTRCGLCGKYKESSPLYIPPAAILCFSCGGIVDAASGVCTCCGEIAFAPLARMSSTPRAGDEKTPALGS